MRGAGGTPGGLGTFLAGAAMVVAGGYLLLNQVTVTSGYWYFWGYNAFGLSLFPRSSGSGFCFSMAVAPAVRPGRRPDHCRRHHRQPGHLPPTTLFYTCSS
jgi:predicted membrane channel-forming protein YqfA (hemolysin III family)